tara:strand:- start:320 stop:508 length:189 start_codon:yes stop_codon:yes gene_type:complete
MIALALHNTIILTITHLLIPTPKSINTGTTSSATAAVLVQKGKVLYNQSRTTTTTTTTAMEY